MYKKKEEMAQIRQKIRKNAYYSEID